MTMLPSKNPRSTERPKRERELTTHWLFTRNGVARVLPSTGAMPVVAAGWLYSARGRSSIRGRNQKSPTATPSDGLAACASAEAELATRTVNVAAAMAWPNQLRAMTFHRTVTGTSS